MRRIKKLAGVLVAALLTVQVLAVMPVYAEETGEKCCHADCDYYKQGYQGTCSECSKSCKFNYASNEDGKTHHYNVICSRCEKVVSEGEELCSGDEGTCTNCQQAITGGETCCHSGCKNHDERAITYCSKCSFNPTVTSNNDGYSHTQNVTCPGCSYTATQIEDCIFSNGECVSCGQAQQFTTCRHGGCNNPIAEGSSVCTRCSGAWSVTTHWEPVDAQSHRTCTYYPCCSYTDISAGVEAHSFGADGRCKCGYQKGGSSSANENNSNNDSNSVTETAQNSQAEANPAEAVRGVVTQSGKKVTSSLTSTVVTNVVNGAAVITSKQLVNEAVEITDSSSNASFFVCNNRNAKKLEQMNEQAQKSGKTLYNVFNSDLYTITKAGVIEKIHETEQPITLIFELPSALRNKKVSIIAYNNKTGEYVEFEDIDDDPNTITIDATVFGVYALVISE